MKLTIELDEKLAKWLEEKSKREGKQVDALILETLEKQLKEESRLKAIEAFRKHPGWNLGFHKVDREWLYEDRY